MNTCLYRCATEIITFTNKPQMLLLNGKTIILFQSEVGERARAHTCIVLEAFIANHSSTYHLFFLFDK